MALQNKPITKENALRRLEMLCVKAERCENELLEKMRGWGLPGSEIREVLESLQSRRFYDNRRFAEAFARDKMLYNHWGKRKIAFSLSSKRIPSGIVKEAIETIDSEEYWQVMLATLRSKAFTIKEGNTFEGRTKLFRFAMARGFESELVSKAIRMGGLFPLDNSGVGE